MKTTFIALVLLFALSMTLLKVLGDAEPEPVLDIEGKKLQAKVNYYILPALKCEAHSTKCRDKTGLALFTTRNKTCPFDVVEASSAMPLTFTPSDPTKSVVRVSIDLNIKFSASSSTTCSQSKVWKLDHFDESRGQWFVTTGGVEGNPGLETISNWFEIEKDDQSSYYYKLVFCPKMCKFCKVLCKDLGTYIDEDSRTRLLALSDVPYKVMFKNA